jgi:hypothetical protein
MSINQLVMMVSSKTVKGSREVHCAFTYQADEHVIIKVKSSSIVEKVPCLKRDPNGMLTITKQNVRKNRV